MSAIEEEIIADMHIRQPVLQQFIDTITPLVEECRINISGEGFTVHVVDPANVASIIPVKLKASGFESIDVPGQSGTRGLNVRKLDKYLNKAKSDDLVRLRLDMGKRNLLIDYRGIHHTMTLINPDTVRKEPDDPNLELANTVSMNGSALREAVEVADLVSDHIRIKTGPDKNAVIFDAKDDTDDMDYTVKEDPEDGGAELLRNDITDADAASLFDLEYMKEFTKPIPSDSEVTIEYGTEYPVILNWTAEDGAISVKQCLAPRIQS